MERTVRVPNSSPIDVPDNVSISTEHISKPEYEHVAASDASVNGSRSSGTVVNPVIDEPANRVAVGAPRAEVSTNEAKCSCPLYMTSHPPRQLGFSMLPNA